MDGLIYAAISKNMAGGEGSFWYPHLSETFFPEFHEHPPLALAMQSVLFRIFGNSIYIERFYSLLTYLIAGFIIIGIWKEVTGERKTAWIPLFLWILVPNISWACANNMLENTMTVFVCFSVLFYLKSLKNRRLLFLILSGFAITAGVLSKGFTALFPWSLPLWFWLFTKRTRFSRMAFDTLLIILFSTLPVVLLFINSPETADSLTKYFNKQVLGSIQNVQTVDSRFSIVWGFLSQIILPVIIGIFVLIAGRIKKVDPNLFKKNVSLMLAFFLLSFCGVFPIMISMKQRLFYVLSTYPFFAIGLGVLILPVSRQLLSRIKQNSTGMKIFTVFSCILLVTGIVLSITQINNIGRDKDKIHDVKLITEKIPSDSIISICPGMWQDWSLHGYFARYGAINLDAGSTPEYDYYLTDGNCDNDVLKTYYKRVEVEARKYNLYKRK